MGYFIALTVISFILTNLLFITNANNSQDHRIFTELFLPLYWVGVILVFISNAFLAALVINGFFGVIIVMGVINQNLKKRR